MCLFDEDVMEPMPPTNAMAAMEAIKSAEKFITVFKRVERSMTDLQEKLEQVREEDLPAAEHSFKRARLEYERHTESGIPGPREKFVKECVRLLDEFRMETIDGDTLMRELYMEEKRFKSWPAGPNLWARKRAPAPSREA